MAIYMPSVRNVPADFRTDCMSSYAMTYGSRGYNILLSSKKKLVDVLRLRANNSAGPLDYVWEKETDDRFLFNVAFPKSEHYTFIEYECMDETAFFGLCDSHSTGNSMPLFYAFNELLEPYGGIRDNIPIDDEDESVPERERLVRYIVDDIIGAYCGEDMYYDDEDDDLRFVSEDAVDIALSFRDRLNNREYKKILSDPFTGPLFESIIEDSFDDLFDADFLFKHYDVLSVPIFERMEPDYPNGLILFASKDVGTYMSIRESIPESYRVEVDAAIEVLKHPFSGNTLSFSDMCKGNFIVASTLGGYFPTKDYPYACDHDGFKMDKWDFFQPSDLHPFYEDALRLLSERLPKLIDRFGPAVADA